MFNTCFNCMLFVYSIETQSKKPHFIYKCVEITLKVCLKFIDAPLQRNSKTKNKFITSHLSLTRWTRVLSTDDSTQCHFIITWHNHKKMIHGVVAVPYDSYFFVNELIKIRISAARFYDFQRRRQSLWRADKYYCCSYGVLDWGNGKLEMGNGLKI